MPDEAKPASARPYFRGESRLYILDDLVIIRRREHELRKEVDMYGTSRNGRVVVTLLTLAALVVLLHQWSHPRPTKRQNPAPGNTEVAGGSAMPSFGIEFKEPKFDNLANFTKDADVSHPLDTLLQKEESKDHLLQPAGNVQNQKAAERPLFTKVELPAMLKMLPEFKHAVIRGAPMDPH